MENILQKTLFLAKQLDDFNGFLIPGKDYRIVACRSSEAVLSKYPDTLVYEIITGNRTYSTQSIFKEFLKNYSDRIGISECKYVWTYQAYPWTNDLKMAGIQVFCIDYLLYLKLYNKLNQRKLLLQHSAESELKLNGLRTNLLDSIETMKSIIFPRYMMDYQKLHQRFKRDFVLSDSHSDGGEGIYKISSENEYINAMLQIKSPVIKADLFLQSAIPVNQIAFVISDGSVVKYKPSVQIIKSIHQRNKLEYAGCDFNSEKHLPNSDLMIASITKLTHQIGKILYSIGYQGVFGCDYIIKDNNIHFIEINPRYQASTLIATRSNGNDKFIAPHILHILGFVEVPEIFKLQLIEYNKEDCFVEIDPKSDCRGFIKVYNEIPDELYKPISGVKIEDGLEKGYWLFKDTVVKSPYYPTQLNVDFSVI